MPLSIPTNRTKTPSKGCFALLTLLVFCCASASAQATKSQRLTLQAGADKHAFLTEAIFPWAHNAYNSSAYGYSVQVNQDITITAQLNAGQRLIDLDLQYCHGYNDPLRLSHNICGSGDSPFWHRLDEIAAWFAADSERLENEVIILYLEAGLVEMMDTFADPRFDLPITALRNSGLDDLVYRPSSSCTDFEHFAQRATKADVLNAGKNILLYGADSETCNHDGWGTWTFKTPTAKRVEHGVYYPMVMNRFDGYPSCSYETELFWHKTTHYMHLPTRFNYAYNDVWALSPLNTMSSGEIDKMTGCGVNAISHEYFDPESATHGALIWSWADGEPNAGASSTSNCAKLGVSGLEDRQCNAGHYFACRHLDTGEWRVTSSYGPWEDGAQTCYEELGVEYGFSMPANGWQMNKLKDARPSSSTQVWVNYNDIDDHGDWEPFQQLTEAVFDFEAEIDGTVHGTSTIDMGFTGGSVPYTQGRDSSLSAIDFNTLADPVLKGTWEQRFDDDLTISVWFRAAPGAAPTENQRLVEFSATGSWTTSTALIMETSGALTAWCEDEVDGARHAVLGTGSTTYLDGRWHRAVFVHSDEDARLYVNGVLEGSTTDTCGDIADARYLSIGSYYNDSVNRKFHGAIDAVDIYGFALSSTEIGEGSKIVGDWAGGALCLDAAGGHDAVNGRNVQVWSCGTTTSSWVYNPGTGRMHAAWNPSLCLDVVGQNSSATDTNVRVWRCDQVTETWTYDPGDRKIRTAYNPNMCLDVAGHQSTTPGRNVQIHPCNNVNETWNEPAVGALPSLQPIEIVGDWAGGSMCLDAAGGHNAGHRANIQSWSCATTTSTWAYNSGTRKIHAGWDDSLCVDVAGVNSSATDANVQLWRCDEVTETWIYDPEDRKIRTAYNPSLCLDVAGHQSTTNGRNAQIHPCNNVNETWNGAGS